MEDFGYKYIHKLPQFIATTNSRNNRSIDMKPNHFKNSDFMSILYSKPLREYKKPKFGIGDRVRISKYDLPFRKCFKPQFTQEIFRLSKESSRVQCGSGKSYVSQNSNKYFKFHWNECKTYVDNERFDRSLSTIEPLFNFQEKKRRSYKNWWSYL